MLISFFTLFLAATVFLLYEVLLMKILGIVGWSHYAYMVVSLSMLGLGFGGVILGLFADFFKKKRDFFILAGGFAFSFLLPLIFYLNQKLPLNYLYLAWEWRQFIYIGLSFFLYGIPFLIISTILALFFLKYPQKSNQVYAVNLIGSGLGIFLAILIMHFILPRFYIFIIATLGAAMALFWGLGYPKLSKRLIVIFLFGGALFVNIFFLPSSLLSHICEYKGLSSLLRLPGTRVVNQYYNPFAFLHILEGEKIRMASGLSIAHKEEVYPQKAITFNADAPLPILDQEKLTPFFFENMIYSAGYITKSNPATLLVGAGGFGSVWLANHHQSQKIKVLEINPQVITALKENMTDSFNWLKKEKNLEIIKKDARSYIESSKEKFDVIQIDPSGTLSSSAAGLHAQNQDYLNTVKAYQLFIQRLAPHGIFMVSRWVSTPAKDGIKLFATGVEALEQLGIKNPAKNLVLIRNWDVITLLIKKDSFTGAELEKIENFCREKYFDIAYLPGRKQANQFHILPEPIYHQAAHQIVNKETRQDFYNDYLFNIRPATDDKPYFSHFFKWAAFTHLVRTLGREWIPFSEYGYLILLATFFQLLIIGGLIIIIPLIILKKRERKRGGVEFKFYTWFYFSFLGLAFMVLEVSLIQKFILFLHNPIYSASIVIGSFLLISGAGSMLSRKLLTRPIKHQLSLFLAIFFLALIYAFFLELLFFKLMGLNFQLKLLLSVLIIAPLAFLLGIPFPLAMAKISPTGEANTGIAWGYNGFFSVMAAISTPLLTMRWGNQAVILTGGFLYLLAMLNYLGHIRSLPSQSPNNPR